MALSPHAVIAALLVAVAWGQAGAAKPLEPTPAVASPIAAEAMMLGAAWAGPRAVAVGDQGIVLLSDDFGKTSRQAKQVPLSSTLTAVAFADARHGWAVGHWGAILATADGGETWRIQRIDTAEDRPLFAVHFFDPQRGVAVGLWSLVLTTDDGGQTWVQQTLAPPPGSTRADANLLSLFADARGRLWATGERGLVLRSADQGRTWVYQSTGYAGSLWAGIALADDTLVVGGQRGSVYRSSDGGQHWTRIDLDNKSSVTGFAAGGAEVLLVGLDGLRATSKDAGQHFAVSVRPDRIALTTALRTPAGAWLMWSRHGLAPEPTR
ncbi:MAG TPA: YCF48-related protein [Burkholderiaceae bacterium]|nr:YCF48-related protein [Burkholderiaceae bacterium]